MVVGETHLLSTNWDGLGTEIGVLHAWESEEMCADAHVQERGLLNVAKDRRQIAIPGEETHLTGYFLVMMKGRGDVGP